MPVKAHDRRVVSRRAASGLKYGMYEILHGFSRLHLRPRHHPCFDVHGCGVALRHAVGEKHESVTWLQRQPLDPVFPPPHNPEGWVGLQGDEIDVTVAQSERQRMTCVHDGCGLGAQVDARDLASYEVAPPDVIAEPSIGEAGLLAQPDSGPPRVSERADEYRREH